jgi:hypothetical protein
MGTKTRGRKRSLDKQAAEETVVNERSGIDESVNNDDVVNKRDDTGVDDTIKKARHEQPSTGEPHDSPDISSPPPEDSQDTVNHDINPNVGIDEAVNNDGVVRERDRDDTTKRATVEDPSIEQPDDPVGKSSLTKEGQDAIDNESNDDRAASKSEDNKGDNGIDPTATAVASQVNEDPTDSLMMLEGNDGDNMDVSTGEVTGTAAGYKLSDRNTAAPQGTVQDDDNGNGKSTENHNDGSMGQTVDADASDNIASGELCILSFELII